MRRPKILPPTRIRWDDYSGCWHVEWALTPDTGATHIAYVTEWALAIDIANAVAPWFRPQLAITVHPTSGPVRPFGSGSFDRSVQQLRRWAEGMGA